MPLGQRHQGCRKGGGNDRRHNTSTNHGRTCRTCGHDSGAGNNNDGGSKEPNMSVSQKIEILGSILTEPSTCYGSKATSLKERCIYSLARAHCAAASDSPSDQNSVSSFLTGPTCRPFLQNITRAKYTKVVRAVLNIICAHTPSLTLQAAIFRSILSWCTAQTRYTSRQACRRGSTR